ncbi:hypothetical protein RIF29_09854 [Crotalaria pallida]|uniref:Uncharacterized protein n=1 Tax=Crotalaria pallida TaxID=3830 RepID=A0AAN9IKN0_CROPI
MDVVRDKLKSKKPMIADEEIETPVQELDQNGLGERTPDAKDQANEEGQWQMHQEKDLHKKYREVYQKALSFCKQKAKEQWLKEWDLNTTFFHKAIRQRRYRNKILRVKDLKGVDCTDTESIQNAFLQYYTEYTEILNGD